MSVLESIMRGVQRLPLRQQVEVASHVFRLDVAAQKERAELLRSLHGCLNEEDGKAFEEALADSRRIEPHE